tara:strand:- start:214 stop:531 length:318 start_codon:yes stop_codon:yes gene_type:complete
MVLARGIEVDHSNLLSRLKKEEKLTITCQSTMPKKSWREERSQRQISLTCREREGLGITQTLKGQENCLGRKQIQATIHKEQGKLRKNGLGKVPKPLHKQLLVTM